LIGIPVVPYDHIRTIANNVVIVIATNNFKEELKAQLEADAIPFYCSLDDKKQFFYYLQIYKWFFPLSELELDKAQQAHDLLADESSKQIFLSRISLLTSYADYQSFRCFIEQYGLCSNYLISQDFQVSEYTENFESYLYFNNDVLKLQQQEVLIDAGAFDGDSAREFIQACERQNASYKHIFCVEADAQNFHKLQLNTADISGISLHDIGLWSSSTKLRFSNSEANFITEACIIEDPDEFAKYHSFEESNLIETTTIDELAQEQTVTFIKMDIEGAELEALKGAQEIILRDRPKLAISLYHKKADIYEIPLFIKRLSPEYKIYIRHLSTHLCETVMFAYV